MKKKLVYLTLLTGVFFSPFLAAEGITRQAYDDYLDRFNNNDPSFIEFYHPDVVLELAGSQIRTAQGIKDFYADVKQYIKETVEVTEFIMDGNKLAVEIPTTFEVIADREDSFWGVLLKKGKSCEPSVGVFMISKMENSSAFVRHGTEISTTGVLSKLIDPVLILLNDLAV